jgi:hypothetical protein
MREEFSKSAHEAERSVGDAVNEAGNSIKAAEASADAASTQPMQGEAPALAKSEAPVPASPEPASAPKSGA